MIADCVDPFDQLYELKTPLELNVVVEPSQMLSVPAIETAGNGFTTTDWLAFPEQPLLSVTVTVYVPLVLTEIDGDVDPLDHATVFPAGTDRFTLLPWQMEVGPEAVIPGAGFGNTCTETVSDTAVQLLPCPY